MSLDQVAASTKIPRPSLELLEDDRGHDLPGPVFVKGFLRCYAKALGVQPEVVLELLYERERVALQARRRERPTEPHRIAPPVHPGSFEQFRRPRRTSGASNAAWQKLLPTLPSTQILLWIAVAVLVAVVLLAAFNLAGSSPGVAAQS